LEYRRGTTVHQWEKFWHWHEECKGYPERNFAVRQDSPLEENLCPKCKNLGRSGIPSAGT